MKSTSAVSLSSDDLQRSWLACGGRAEFVFCSCLGLQKYDGKSCVAFCKQVKIDKQVGIKGGESCVEGMMIGWNA